MQPDGGAGGSGRRSGEPSTAAQAGMVHLDVHVDMGHMEPTLELCPMEGRTASAPASQAAASAASPGAGQPPAATDQPHHHAHHPHVVDMPSYGRALSAIKVRQQRFGLVLHTAQLSSTPIQALACLELLPADGCVVEPEGVSQQRLYIHSAADGTGHLHEMTCIAATGRHHPLAEPRVYYFAGKAPTLRRWRTPVPFPC